VSSSACQFGLVHGVALELLDDDEDLLSLVLHRKGGATPLTQGVIAALHGQLDILGVVIASTDDDQVLASTDDEELPAMEEAQVACPKVCLL
jgi:hypothetical protein